MNLCHCVNLLTSLVLSLGLVSDRGVSDFDLTRKICFEVFLRGTVGGEDNVNEI